MPQTNICTIGELLGKSERKIMLEKSEYPSLDTPVRDLTVNDLRHIITVIAAPPFKSCLPAQAISILYRRADSLNLII